MAAESPIQTPGQLNRAKSAKSQPHPILGLAGWSSQATGLAAKALEQFNIQTKK